MVRLTEVTEEDRVNGIQRELGADDRCYFIHEYTIGENYSAATRGNSVIFNIKRSPTECGGRAEFAHFKNRDRDACARIFRANINSDFLNKLTIVPVPPSAARNDPAREFDDTLVRLGQQIAGATGDCRELVVQSLSTRSLHKSAGSRLTVAELLQVYQLNKAVANPAPSNIAILDDLLTKGTHYNAMKMFLRGHFPDARFLGLFVAKAVPNPNQP